MKPAISRVCDLDPADRQLIDREHARLEGFVHNLRETCVRFDTPLACASCSREKFASCQGRLTSFCYDFMDLVAEHCENEERIICNSLRISNDEYFQRHKAEHARLMRDMAELMSEVSAMNRSGDTAQAIRLLHQWISETFEAHAHTYDQVFLGY